jgi:hypothetical protein
MRREQLISVAVRQRLSDVVQRASEARPEEFKESEFVSLAVKQIGQHEDRSIQTPEQWSNYERGCLDALQRLALNQDLEAVPAGAPSTADFITAYRKAKDSSERWQLLTERYSNPLNILLVSESDCSELILERLMVQDRVRVGRNTFSAIDADEVLLKLNLVALHADNGSDLRFLDALNYYYELLPASFHKNSQRNWLLVSYWVLYIHRLRRLHGFFEEKYDVDAPDRESV